MKKGAEINYCTTLEVMYFQQTFYFYFLFSIQPGEKRSRKQPKQRLQRLQHIPVPRTGVRLFEKFRNRRKNQQNSVAQPEKPVPFSIIHKRFEFVCFIKILLCVLLFYHFVGVKLLVNL